ncbi:MAG: cell division protein FtsZ [Candidatus Aenigmarchaeota archaeon]|nr:cell division protein FtsZ [Candidatus Aenigmarchaeota archaeon]
MGVKQIAKKGARPSKYDTESKDDAEIRSILESRKTKIKIVGCGGGGNNTITRLNQVGVVGAETIAINTDAQDLLYTDADKKILIGKELTKGLGAGANPSIGMEAARETKQELEQALRGADMVFMTCGLGGGTGTGSIPVVAEISKRAGALTVAVVTLPFAMEGKQRMANAREGLKNLEGVADTMIIIPNDRLLEIVPDVSIITAFKIADEILVNAVKGITELVTKPGLVNLDFADVRAVMGGSGMAMIGMGESDTDNRAFEAVERALNNPLLAVDIEGATGALINVTGGPGITMREAHQIVEAVSSKLAPDAKIIWGAQVEEDFGDRIRALLIVTGVKAPQIFGGEKSGVKRSKKDIEYMLGVDFVE